MFAQRYGLARLSIGGVLRMMLDTHEHTDLGVEIKNHLNQGDVVPDELAIQALEVVLMCAVYNFQGWECFRLSIQYGILVKQSKPL